jgi:FlaA1/EpsC-like NDP-sugar epimerase
MELIRKIQQFLGKTSKRKALFFIVLDFVFISFAVWISFLLRFDFIIPAQFNQAVEKTLVLAVIFYLPIFYFFGLYSFSWSYVSTRELVALIISSIFAISFTAFTISISNEFSGFNFYPRSVLFILYFLILLLAGGTRFSKRIYLEFLFSGKKEKLNTLIVGAGDAGEQILRNIQSFSSSSYFPIGFVDDNPSKQNNYIHGVKIFGEIDSLAEVIKKQHVESVIIALPSAQITVQKKAVENARKAGVKDIKILPPLSEIVNGNISLQDIRDFRVEDLLERDPVLYDVESIKGFLSGKRVLITGAAGSIGSELSRQVARFSPSALLLLDQDETGIFNISEEIKRGFPNVVSVVSSIQNKQKIEKVFNDYRPQIVFHTAAYKHVPLMEAEPEEAVRNNVFGTKTLAQICLDYNVDKFIFISTDKAVNPVSVMGVSKRVGEMICLLFNKKGLTRFISVRFGNVLGSRGSVIPVFKEQIKRGGPVQVTHEDMKRYFMIIPEAVSLVLQAGQMGKGGEVFVLNMGDPVRIIDLAKDTIRLSGLEPDKDILIVFTNPRPGEKMFEEMLTAEEGTTATENKNIYVANLSPVNEADIAEKLIALADSLSKQNRDEIVKSLYLIVKNS